jgi:hypothetical protein
VNTEVNFLAAVEEVRVTTSASRRVLVMHRSPPTSQLPEMRTLPMEARIAGGQTVPALGYLSSSGNGCFTGASQTHRD